MVPALHEDTSNIIPMSVGAVPPPVMIPLAATKSGMGFPVLPKTAKAEKFLPGTENEASQPPATLYVCPSRVRAPVNGPSSPASRDTPQRWSELTSLHSAI